MRLKKFHVTAFQSVLDSGPVDVNEITCLVGKNEAGKSALLKALYKLNPIRAEDANYSVTDDYPRVEVTDYEDQVIKGKRKPAVVAQVTYELGDEEVGEVEETFGAEFLTSRELVMSKLYDNSRTYILSCNERAAINFLARNLSSELQQAAGALTSAKEFGDLLEPHASEPAVAAIIELVRESKSNSFTRCAWARIIKEYEPKFLYFDEYYQMIGCENIEALQQRINNKTLKPSDQPLLGLIELARLDIPQLTCPRIFGRSIS